MTAPLTLIVDGKPLVFDVPVPVGEVIPAGTAVMVKVRDGLWHFIECTAVPIDPVDERWFIARTPASFHPEVEGTTPDE